MTATVGVLVLLVVQVWGLTGTPIRLWFQPMHYLGLGLSLPLENHALLATLERKGIRHVNGDYWTVAPLAVESGGAVIPDDGGDRYRPFHESFLRSPRVGYVLHKHLAMTDGTAEFFTRCGFEVTEVPPYLLFIPPFDALPRKGWHAESRWAPEAAPLAVDGDVMADPGGGSTWNAPDLPENWIRVDFDSPIRADRVAVLEGLYTARRFREHDNVPVYLELLEGDRVIDLGPMDVNPYVRFHSVEFPEAVITGIRLTSGRGEETSAWSIREIFVFPGIEVDRAPEGQGVAVNRGESGQQVPQVR